MNKIIPLLVVVFFFYSAPITYAQQVEKTLVKSFNLHGHQVVEAALPGAIEVKTWKNNTMRVQMVVGLANGSVNMLKSLVQVGRYNLNGTDDEEQFTISAPSLEKEVKLKNGILQEQVSFLIFAPENVVIKQKDETTNSTAENISPSSL